MNVRTYSCIIEVILYVLRMKSLTIITFIIWNLFINKAINHLKFVFYMCIFDSIDIIY